MAAIRAVTLVAPALLLPLAGIIAVSRHLPESLALAVHAAPLVVLVGGALLGLVIGRGRLVLALIALGLVNVALLDHPDTAVLSAAALLLPLNLAVITWLPDVAAPARPAAAWIVVIVVQAAAVLVLPQPELAPLAASLAQPLLHLDFGVWSPLPQPALAAFGLAGVLVVTRVVTARCPFAAATVWALVAALLALDGAATAGDPGTVHMAAAGLLLVVGGVLQPPRPANVDTVTGLPTTLELHKMLRRLPRRYALARVDIDEFVRFREAHGADAARQMLRLTAETLARVGGGGRAFYCGAHGFVIVLRRHSAADAAHRCDVVRRQVEAAAVDVSALERPRSRPAGPARLVKRTVSVTISAGIAAATARGTDPHELLAEAERALVRAKQGGLNRISA